MIVGNYIGLIEMGFTGGAVLAFCVWQYWLVRDAGKPKDDLAKSNLPSDSGHTEGEHHPHDR